MGIDWKLLVAYLDKYLLTNVAFPDLRPFLFRRFGGRDSFLEHRQNTFFSHFEVLALIGFDFVRQITKQMRLA